MRIEGINRQHHQKPVMLTSRLEVHNEKNFTTPISLRQRGRRRRLAQPVEKRVAQQRVGDALDAWRVIAVEPERRLTLLMEMKAPGSGVLEFEIRPESDGHRITATAYFHPAGVWGLLYWYAFEPMHKVIFSGTAREICRRAEQRRPARTTALPHQPRPDRN